jgi:hypothetical protein
MPAYDRPELLRRYDYIWHAEHVAQCRQKLDRDGPTAFRDFATLEWWGGAGSIADVYLYRETSGQCTATAIVDDQKFRAALISIYDQMKDAGVVVERAESWTDIFREWRRQGI